MPDATSSRPTRPLRSLHAHTYLESLESRRLMSADADALRAHGFEPIDWNGQAGYAKAGQWIVRLDGLAGNANDQLAAADALVKKAGKDLKASQHLGADGLLLLEAPKAMNYGQLKKLLDGVNGFRYVEPDFVIELQATQPNDPSYSSLYGMNNTGQLGGTPDADIDAPEAWDISTGSSDVVIAVLDTGIGFHHTDLNANMWRNAPEASGTAGVDDDGNGFVDDIFGYDAINLDSVPMDDHSHGTHVAGTIAARGNNGTGVVGVNQVARLMAVKMIDASGFGTTSDAVRGINYVNLMKSRGVNVRVANASWGGDPFMQSLFDAIARMRDNGILFVAAAGNGNIFGQGINNDTTPFYPANYNLDNIISVAATTRTDARASFSNYGLTTVDLGAPGVDVYSTTLNSTYGTKSGTSMAAPHVSGVAALAAAVAPAASYTTIRQAIFNGVDVISSLSGRTVTGGRLNAHNTLQLLLPATAAHDAPTFLSATAVSAARVDLSWADNAGNETAFNVYRSPTGVDGTFALVGTAGQNVKSFSDTTVSGGTTYYYRVRASNTLGESANSNTASATTPVVTPAVPAAPSNLVATALSGSQIRLNWQDNANNETGFRVERSTNGSNWTQIASEATLGPNTTTFVNSGLARKTRYFYRVRAVNNVGVSPYSNTANARTTNSLTVVATSTAELFSSSKQIDASLLDELEASLT